ncbi:MAG: ATP-binding protein, partial [Moheibacter sp.]
MEIVGRKPEIQRLTHALQSQNSELVVVYGRRRIGKTFLIREFFKENIVFEVAGLYDGNLSDQLAVFYKQLNQGKKAKQTWMEAFSDLEKHINRLRSKKKKVIFIDEFPWLATKRSKFLMAFDHFWNTYCTKRDDLAVVICGSAASYMIKNIINNKGGLHNRITQKIRLLPFNLSETQEYLQHKKIQYTHYDILQIYMSLGGVPYYL